MMLPSVVADQRVLGLADGILEHSPTRAKSSASARRGSGDPDLAHVGEVEQARGLADGVVFGQFASCTSAASASRRSR